MALNADELGKRLAALSERFAGLAETLAQTAGQLQASGSLPAESLIDEITKIRTDFVDVRQRVLEAARSLSINAPGMSEIDSLKALGPVLETVVQALAVQEKQAALAEARTRVMAVLDRLGGLALFRSGPRRRGAGRHGLQCRSGRHRCRHGPSRRLRSPRGGLGRPFRRLGRRGADHELAACHRDRQGLAEGLRHGVLEDGELLVVERVASLDHREQCGE